DIPGGTFVLGAHKDEAFAFDNEKWAHEVELEPFSIARAPVTNAEFAEFVDDGGYAERDLWSDAGWAWRESEEATQPVYWRRGSNGWEVRSFQRWTALPPNRPVSHVNWHEAQAYCRWAGRRLPTEAEWEAAASVDDTTEGQLSRRKRRFPWGDQPPGTDKTNLDGRALGTVDVAAFSKGDSALGCRQMIGNVWEWTSSVFEPFDGFEPDFYQEYSEPWFGDRRVLRGGSWATRSRLIWNTFRNFFPPDRRDVIAGFRTCAL
ncbi:MAG: SUMF1/EgtB/PvdO family nonheme iron enzyme, partial [Myxococcota bacterium]